MTEREEKWTVKQDPDGYWTVWAINGAVADFCTEKNAHLIAAAPALYEALVELNAELDAFWNDPTQFEARSHISEVNKQLITMAQIKCATALSQARGETGEEG